MPWKKGQSGNPTGRPSQGLDALKRAIAKVEKEKGKSFFVHCVEMAYGENAQVMAQALLRKLIPDLKHLEGEVKLEHVNMMREVIRELAKKDGS